MTSQQSSLKEEADRLMRIKGNSRGEILRTHAVYISAKEGREGVSKIETKLKELGYPLVFEEVKPMEWYPEGLGVLLLLVAKEIFHWNDADIFEMGNAAPQYSLIARLLMKYFISPERSFKESPKYWQGHYDFGTLEAAEFDEKEKYLVIRVKEYKFHPIICTFHSGYFLRIAQFVIGSEGLTIEETVCMFKGGPYHEYVIRW